MISSLTQGPCATYSFCFPVLRFLLAFAATLLLPSFDLIKGQLRDAVDSNCLQCTILYSSFSSGLTVAHNYDYLYRVSVNKEHIMGKQAETFPLIYKCIFSFVVLVLKWQLFQKAPKLILIRLKNKQTNKTYKTTNKQTNLNLIPDSLSCA